MILTVAVAPLFAADPFDDFDDPPAPVSADQPVSVDQPVQADQPVSPDGSAAPVEPVADDPFAEFDAPADLPLPGEVVDPGAAMMPAKKPKRVGVNSVTYSFRAECILIDDEVATVGAGAEGGMLYANGLFMSASLHGGMNYAGALLSAGYSSGNAFRSIVGASGGFQYFWWPVYVRDQDKVLIDEDKTTASFGGGPFVKLLAGGSSNFDMTLRAIVGYKSNSVRYDEDIYKIVKEDGVSVSYSVSMGYTLIRGRGGK